MGLLLPKLAVGLLFGFAASLFAFSQGYGLLGALLIYSVAGQVVFLLLVGLDLLRDGWTERARQDREREAFASAFADDLVEPGIIDTR